MWNCAVCLSLWFYWFQEKMFTFFILCLNNGGIDISDCLFAAMMPGWWIWDVRWSQRDPGRRPDHGRYVHHSHCFYLSVLYLSLTDLPLRVPEQILFVFRRLIIIKDLNLCIDSLVLGRSNPWDSKSRVWEKITGSLSYLLVCPLSVMAWSWNDFFSIWLELSVISLSMWNLFCYTYVSKVL